VFRHRDFRLLLIGQTTSQLGAQIAGVAVPLLAVLTLHATPIEVGMVTAAGTIAFAVIGLPAGAWLDRTRRRPVLVAADVVRALVLLTIPLTAWLGHLGIAQLIVVSFVAGIGRVFFDVGYQSYLPTVVERRNLLTGNSTMEAVRACGQVLGPGLGGWLVAVAGAANVLLLQAVTFAVSAVSLLAIRAPESRPAPAGPRLPLRTEIRDGLRFVARTPVLRACALTSAAGNFAFAIASTVGVLFMLRTVELSPTGVGLVTGVGSITAIVGAAATPWLARRVGSARVVWWSLAATGPFGLLAPLARPGWPVAFLVAGMAAGEFGQIVYSVTNVSLRQRLCPPHLLSRVNATMRMLVMCLFPLGALLGGLSGELIGLRPTLWLSGAIVLASTLPVYRALRHLRDVEEVPPWAPR
jgi:MFS family permease